MPWLICSSVAAHDVQAQIATEPTFTQAHAQPVSTLIMVAVVAAAAVAAAVVVLDSAYLSDQCLLECAQLIAAHTKLCHTIHRLLHTTPAQLSVYCTERTQREPACGDLLQRAYS
jgi:hypothetical protein